MSESWRQELFGSLVGWGRSVNVRKAPDGETNGGEADEPRYEKEPDDSGHDEEREGTQSTQRNLGSGLSVMTTREQPAHSLRSRPRKHSALRSTNSVR